MKHADFGEPSYTDNVAPNGEEREYPAIGVFPGK